MSAGAMPCRTKLKYIVESKPRIASTSPFSSSASRSRRSPNCHWIESALIAGEIGVGGEQLVGAVGERAADFLPLRSAGLPMPVLREAADRERRAVVEHVDGLAGIRRVLGVELHQHVDVAEPEVIGAAADAGDRLARAARRIERWLQPLGGVVALVLGEEERGVGAVIRRIERDLQLGLRRDRRAPAEGRQSRPLRGGRPGSGMGVRSWIPPRIE